MRKVVVLQHAAMKLTPAEEKELAELRPNPEIGNYKRFIELLVKQERFENASKQQ